MAGPGVEVRRVYEDPARRRGEHRVLVDRLWPRGLSKAAVDDDEWAKELAPSTELRRWFGHDPGRFDEFARRYRAELALPAATQSLDRLATMAARRPVVLLTATRDVEHSGARVLREVLGARRGEPSIGAPRSGAPTPPPPTRRTPRSRAPQPAGPGPTGPPGPAPTP